MSSRPLPWLLLLGLTLIASSALALSLIRKIELDDLDQLENSMAATARAVAGLVAEPLARDPADLGAIKRIIVTTQDAAEMRIRILDSDRSVVADSLGLGGAQDFVRFRPEVQKAYTGQYGAYTRFADETEDSLALFVAVPIYHEGRLVGAAYVSRSTDAILFKLGQLRNQFRNWLIALTVALFVASLMISGQLTQRLRRLGRLAADVVPEDRGLDDVEALGRGLDRLVANLQEKVAELEDEKVKTRRFVEEIAHELKTPLTALQGSVEALQDKPDARLLSNVQRETARLSELVGRLIELQKLDYYEMRWEVFDLSSLLEAVVESYQHAPARVVPDWPEECLVRGDSGKIRRVLENLLDNAIRCSPPMGTVTVSAVVAGENIRVTVRDEGPGVAEAEREAIFERGRGEGSLSNMGLGLAVAREIVRKHGQRLDLETLREGGCVFSFTLAPDTRLTPSDPGAATPSS